jgi:hypothetical protein
MRNLRKTNPGAYKVILGLVASPCCCSACSCGPCGGSRTSTQVDCHSRQEARDGIRALVLVVPSPRTSTVTAPSTPIPIRSNPLIHYFLDTLQPGGALERIDC